MYYTGLQEFVLLVAFGLFASSLITHFTKSVVPVLEVPAVGIAVTVAQGFMAYWAFLREPHVRPVSLVMVCLLSMPFAVSSIVRMLYRIEGEAPE